MKSLGPDFATAKRLASIELLKAQSRFDQARRELTAQSATPVELSACEAWTLAAQWFIDLEKRAESLPRASAADLRGNLATLCDDMFRDAASFQTQKLLERNNIAVELGSPSLALLNDYVLEVAIEHLKRQLTRCSPDAPPNPSNSQLNNRPAPVTFVQLIAMFRASQASTPVSSKTSARRAAADRLFLSIVDPGTLVGDILPHDCEKLQAIISRLPPNHSKRPREIDIEAALEGDGTGKVMNPHRQTLLERAYTAFSICRE